MEIQMNTIYIGNLSSEITEAPLRKIFEKFGKVNEVDIAIDSVSKNKLGFAFIQMPGIHQAEEAVQALHHSKIKARTVIVCLTTSRNERRKTATHKEMANV
jgi:RNA recognition motif-containing protein